MRAARLGLAGAGLMVIGYALVGAARTAQIMPVRQLGFLLAVLTIHDGVFLPLLLGVGLVARWLVPARYRGIVSAALLASGCLVLVALPLVLGYGRLADNPSALPRDYSAGLAILLAAVWSAAVLGVLLRFGAGRLRGAGRPRRAGRFSRRAAGPRTDTPGPRY